MPEFPFLQVLAENLNAQARGRVITAARLHSVSLLKSYDPPLAAAAGRRIEGVRRVAKLVVFDLTDDLSLVLHLMRDGRVQLGMPRARAGKDLALALRLDDGRELRLVELGPKKRASAYLLPTGDMPECEPLRDLGMDPFAPALTPAALYEMLRGESVQTKRFLTLQRYVTSIGNAYSDEILWEARLSPFAPAKTLTSDAAALMLGAIRRTLERALEEHRAYFGGELPQKEPPELLRVHRHAGEPCPRCETPVAQVAYAERETYYCPTCQTGGKVYADRRLSRLLK